MNSKDYWARREEEQRKKNITDEKEYAKKIQEIYGYTLDQVEKEINGFYTKYAKAEGITMAEAKKRVSQLDIDEYSRKAKKYVETRDFSKKANDEMRLYNATMKINRLEMLKANIGLEMVSGFDELDKFFGEKLTDRSLEEMKRQAGILGKTITNNAKMAESIVNASFHNATFSDRIWMYQSQMKAELSKLLQEGLVQGKHPRELARHLDKLFGVGRANAERLMTTELARVQTGAQQKSFEKNGFEDYEFIAEPSACPICAALNGKHFKVSKMMPGENAAPMHPFCRCSVAAWEDSKEYEEWLDFLSKGGTTEEWKEIKHGGAKAKSKATPKKMKATDLSSGLQHILNEYTKGEYGDICEYSQYLKTPDGKVSLFHDNGFWKKERLPQISEATRKATKDIMDIIGKQPVNRDPLCRIERGTFDGGVGDTLTFGIRSASSDMDLPKKAFSGLDNGLKWGDATDGFTEYRFTNSKSLDISAVSNYADQKECLVCGDYKVVKTETIKPQKGGLQDVKKPYKELFPDVEYFTSKKGKEMVRYTEDGKQKTMDLNKYQTGEMFVGVQTVEKVVGRKVVYVELVE